MSTFEVGQRVKCVRDYYSEVTIGKEYVVTSSSLGGVRVVNNNGNNCWYDTARFEPVEDTITVEIPVDVAERFFDQDFFDLPGGTITRGVQWLIKAELDKRKPKREVGWYEVTYGELVYARHWNGDRFGVGPNLSHDMTEGNYSNITRLVPAG